MSRYSLLIYSIYCRQAHVIVDMQLSFLDVHKNPLHGVRLNVSMPNMKREMKTSVNTIVPLIYNLFSCNNCLLSVSYVEDPTPRQATLTLGLL